MEVLRRLYTARNARVVREPEEHVRALGQQLRSLIRSGAGAAEQSAAVHGENGVLHEWFLASGSGTVVRVHVVDLARR